MPRGSSSSSGRVPQRDSQRRRRNKPASYGAADPATGPAASGRPTLGIARPTRRIKDLWDAIQTSAEAPYYSDADWQRVRIELTYGDALLRKLESGEKFVSAQAWKVFQDALTELLVSPAAKRRAGIELKPPSDTDEVEADEVVAEFQRDLKAVP